MRTRAKQVVCRLSSNLRPNLRPLQGFAAFLLTNLATTCYDVQLHHVGWSPVNILLMTYVDKTLVFRGLFGIRVNTKPTNLNRVCIQQCGRMRTEYKIITLCDQRLKYFRRSFLALSVEVSPGLEKMTYFQDWECPSRPLLQKCYGASAILRWWISEVTKVVSKCM